MNLFTRCGAVLATASFALITPGNAPAHKKAIVDECPTLSVSRAAPLPTTQVIAAPIAPIVQRPLVAPYVPGSTSRFYPASSYSYASPALAPTVLPAQLAPLSDGVPSRSNPMSSHYSVRPGYSVYTYVYK